MRHSICKRRPRSLLFIRICVPLPRWENPEKRKDTITWYGPVLAGGRLVVLGSNSQALSLNPVNGETLNSQNLSDSPAPFPPVIVDGTMLVVTDDGRLTAWR